MFKHYHLFRHAILEIQLAPCKVPITFIAICFLFPMTGCYSARAYRGDGRMIAVRLGPWLMHCTYYGVELGSIDLTKKSKNTFTMKGLPHEEMCLGFRTKLSDQNAPFEDNKSDALVKVLLVDEAGRIVVHEEERLTQWTWSAGGEDSFVYHRGHLSNEGQKVLKVVDEAQGTYIKPRTKAKYTLTVEITEPDSKGRYDNVKLEIANLCY
jgi:hypothetical protein